jgi:predicted ATPase/DNA-binding CsgD family transcriptional regulator
LPATIDTLFGRDQEIAELAAALSARSARLVVLTGPGGVGKTRLAIASAAVAAPSFTDGVIFVALAPIRDPTLVAATIAHAAGIRDAGVPPLNIQLVETLAARDLLLVLDNFEHVLPAGMLISELLEGCPTLTILVTSRARLRLAGERDFPVQPLTLPRQQRPPPHGSGVPPPPKSGARAEAQPSDVTVDEIGQSPAVCLFVDRAQAIDPSFRLTSDNAQAVADICRRIDGLPLAIELAAARTPLLPPATLLARLDRRLPLLLGGPRDHPARLQTMRQAIAWSYDLLPPEARSTFQCLAIFVGGFGLDAAEAVCAASVDHVTALLDQTLLLKTAVDPEPRCTMLETIREFALEELAHGGEELPIRNHHAQWCLMLAKTLEPDLYGGRGQVAALRRLEEELPNLRAAFAWLLDTGEPEAALQLAAALGKFMHIRGHNREGRDWLETALARARNAPDALRAWALLDLSAMACAQLDLVRAAEAVGTALPIVTSNNDRRGLAFARAAQALLAFFHGRFAEAAAFAADSETIATEIANRWDVHFARFLRAKAELYAGNLERAEAINRDLIAAAQDEERYITSSARHDGATIRELRGDHAGALALFTRALHDFRELGEYWNAAAALEGVATAAIGLGHADRTAWLMGTADVLRARMGTPVLPPDRPAYERTIAAAREAVGESAFAAGWAAGQAATLDEAIVCASELAAEAVVEQDAQATRHRIVGPRLTPREREVLALLVAGQSDPQIGRALSISARTVESHVAAILAKLGQPSRTAAVAHAVRLRLV